MAIAMPARSLRGDSRGGNGRKPGNTNIDRVDLPSDPFCSDENGAGQPSKNAGPKSTGKPLNGTGSNGHALSDIAPLGDESDDTDLAEIARKLDPGKQRRSMSIARHGGVNPQVAYAADVNPNDLRRQRRRRFQRVGALLFGGTVLAVGAFVGCLKLIPVRSQIEMHLRYKNLAESEGHRRDFITGQSDLIHNDFTRLTAQKKLPADVSPGFLNDRDAYVHVVDSLNWSNILPDELAISFTSTDADGDSARIKAVAEALYDSNSVLLDDAKSQPRSPRRRDRSTKQREPAGGRSAEEHRAETAPSPKRDPRLKKSMSCHATPRS